MIKTILLVFVALLVGLAGGWLIRDQLFGDSSELVIPFVTNNFAPEKPLLSFTLENLRTRRYNASQIQILEEIEDFPEHTSFLFSYTTLGRKMTGQLNLPKQNLPENPPVIILVRGYVPHEIFTTGVGTKNAAAVFANNGYITIAPDFFGYGDSDPEPNDTWEARFEKPVAVIELLETIKKTGVPIEPDNSQKITSDNFGIWAHSNGGQISLATLEITSFRIPITLWAPVTAPFPYSVIFFSDEDADEGQAFRLKTAQFEQIYNVLDFSLTQYLHLLTGPMLLHQGLADDAVHFTWSDKFYTRIQKENERRQKIAQEKEASPSGELENNDILHGDEILDPIDIEYFKSPNTDHNMQPSWNTAIQRDLAFFEEYLR